MKENEQYWRFKIIFHNIHGSGYGYGTVPGGRWTIDTEGGHVVVSVSLIRNGYAYGTVPDRRGIIRTESGHMVNSVSRIRSGYESRRAAVKCPNFTSDVHYYVVCCSPIYLW